MKIDNRIDEDFIEKYQAYESESDEDFIERYAPHKELRDIILYLIHHRELMRDVELERLEAETEKLSKKLEENKQEQLYEEIACFRDILKLQKKLNKDNEKL